MRGASIENLTADPTVGVRGRLWMRTDTSPVIFKVDDGAAIRTFVTTDNVQTLTNKTLTGNIAVTLVSGAATVTLPTSTSTLATLALSETLTNKTLTGNIAVTLVSGAATVTLPTTTGTLATLANSEVFTNKDYDGGTASNTSRLTVPKASLSTLSALTRKEATIVYASDTDKLYKDDGTSLTEIGSGSSGSINYVTNPDAESGVTGWAAYADAAATSPVDGTGGAPTVTITRTTTTPLRGTGSFLLTKDAANRQGEGVGYAFTIDSADKAKVLNVSFDYEIASGTFTSGDSSDVRVFIYDVTNTVLVPVSPNTIQGGSSNQFKFSGTFQTASNSTSYRLIIHCATTSASAYTFEFDNVVVGPQVVNYGAPIGDWTTFTPTCNSTTNTTPAGAWRRVGDSMQVLTKISFAGAPDNVSFTSSLPTGYTIDTTKLTTTSSVNLGSCSIKAAGTLYDGAVHYETTSTVAVYYSNGTSTAMTRTSPATIANLDFIWLLYTVPISGWGSTVIMSNDTDTRVVALIATGDAASAASGAPIIFPTASSDTHGSYNTTTGRYTAPVSGYYQVSAVIGNSGTSRSVYIYVDAAQGRNIGSAVTGSNSSISGLVKVNAGQIIDIRPDGTLDADSGSSLQILRLSGPSSIAATETVAANYTTNAGQTIATATATIVDFEDKNFDTHGAVTVGASWKFTAPVGGKYRVSANIEFAADADWTATETLYLEIRKGGTFYSRLDFRTVEVTATSIHGLSGSNTVSLLAGEYVDVRVTQTSGGDVLLNSTTGLNNIAIERIGN